VVAEKLNGNVILRRSPRRPTKNLAATEQVQSEILLPRLRDQDDSEEAALIKPRGSE
jgi:hypothetical protein